jgi:hypothetical protein
MIIFVTVYHCVILVEWYFHDPHLYHGKNGAMPWYYLGPGQIHHTSKLKTWYISMIDVHHGKNYARPW